MGPAMTAAAAMLFCQARVERLTVEDHMLRNAIAKGHQVPGDHVALVKLSIAAETLEHQRWGGLLAMLPAANDAPQHAPTTDPAPTEPTAA